MVVVGADRLAGSLGPREDLREREVSLVVLGDPERVPRRDALGPDVARGAPTLQGFEGRL